MYRLARVYSVTARQTDRQTDDSRPMMSLADPTALSSTIG